MTSLVGSLIAAPATDSGSLAGYAALAGTIVTIVVTGFNAWNGRQSKRQREAAAKEAEAKSHETEAKSFVLTTGEPVAWRTTDHSALMDERAFTATLKADLVKAENQVRELLDRVAELDRKNDEIAAHMMSMTENMRQLRQSISLCPGGPLCPLHPLLGPDGDKAP